MRDAGDFYGTNVILASRIADEACGGEILISAAFRERFGTPQAETLSQSRFPLPPQL